MARRRIHITVNIALVMLLGLVLIIASCKKSSPPQAPKPASATAPKTETQALKAAAKPDANVAPVPKP